MKEQDRLKFGRLSEQEEDEIFGAFVRRFEEEQLKEKWAVILEQRTGLVRPQKPKATIKPMRRKNRWWSVVAAALLIGIVLFSWNLWQKPLDSQQLLAEEVEQLQLITMRNAQQSAEDLVVTRQQFKDAFQTGRLEESISLGAQLVTRDTITSSDLLHVAFANLRAKNYEEAEELLTELLNRNDLLRVEAQFYLGLTQLSSGNTEAGKGNLRAIGPSAGEKYYQKAVRLLSVEYEEAEE